MTASYTSELVSLFNTFTVLGIIVGVIVLSLMAYLVVRFRARADAPEPEDAPRLGRIPQARGHLKSVIISLTLSSIILGILIFGTLSVANLITTIPAECTDEDPGTPPCLTIRVTAFRFGWNFTYPNGQTNSSLVVPTGRIVVLEIVSADVFHTFGIEEFMVKKDALPGLTNRIWFIAEELTVDLIRCFELCGVGHAGMIARFSSQSPSDFQGSCAGC